MESLIVCHLPGCQIRHVGSQQGFSSQPFMFAQSFFIRQSLQNWIGTLALKKSPARHTSAIGPQCGNCWHFSTEDWRVEGTVGITLLSTLHVMVRLCNGVSSRMAPCNSWHHVFLLCTSNKWFKIAKDTLTEFCQWYYTAQISGSHENWTRALVFLEFWAQSQTWCLP